MKTLRFVRSLCILLGLRIKLFILDLSSNTIVNSRNVMCMFTCIHDNVIVCELQENVHPGNAPSVQTR